MKKIICALAYITLILSSNGLASALEEGKTLQGFALEDQFGKKHVLLKETQKIIFAFSKESGHKCNDFFAKKDKNFLSSREAVFVADISAAPSVVQMLFIKPGLRDFKHTVLVLEDEKLAKRYKTEQMQSKIVVAELKDLTISKVFYFDTIEALEDYLQ